ncbi:hypothetical protein HU200_048421 [Digitaria exilis]|uniref:Cyclin-like domain-containing protein n=1 Tax=Digitaria exilis TaxID=1010633 RepID=A0A835E991_9POAL|nr:hypothetical protein HU200_048421 [Digitaria exilis]
MFSLRPFQPLPSLPTQCPPTQCRHATSPARRTQLNFPISIACGGGNPFQFHAVLARSAPTRTPHAAFSSALLLFPVDDILSFAFPPFFRAHARALPLIDATTMGDAAAAAAAAAVASTSAPATPTSILICREDGSDLFPDADDDDGASADFAVARDDRLLVVDHDDEYVAVLLSKETASAAVDCGGGAMAEEMEEWMKAARSGSFARSSSFPFAGSIYIEEKNRSLPMFTTVMFRFSGMTAYVAVTYLDRFLAHRRVNRGQEWALQLLAVACLSLASKVEEHHARRLSELRLDAYEFDSASIFRMELLVLATLQWRMTAATPFPYISCFAARFRHDERRAIVMRAVECVFAAIKGLLLIFPHISFHVIDFSVSDSAFAAMSSVEYQPSTIAAASILAARGNEETPTAANLLELKAILGSSWPQLDTEHVYSCYSAMIQEDRSSAEVASSGVSVAAHVVGSPDASVGTNNAAGAAPPATPDSSNNKRRRLRSPQRQ